MRQRLIIESGALRYAMIARGLEAGDLAARSGLSEASLKRWLRPGSHGIRGAAAGRLLEALAAAPIRISDLSLIGPDPGPPIRMEAIERGDLR